MKTVTQAIIDLKINFSAFKSVDDVADFICSGYGANYTAINAAGLKRQGCGNGVCACTGYCNIGIEASELDVLSNINYLVMRPHVLRALEELGVTFINKIYVDWSKSPEDATHVYFDNCGTHTWEKHVGGIYYYPLPGASDEDFCWYASSQRLSPSEMSKRVARPKKEVKD